MKRILPRAVEYVNKSIARSQDKRSERERAGDSNIDKRPAWVLGRLPGVDRRERELRNSNVGTNGSKDDVSGDLIKL